MGGNFSSVLSIGNDDKINIDVEKLAPLNYMYIGALSREVR